MNKNNGTDILSGISKSYWIDSTPETNYPSLNEDISVDVAIIGGGITGITSALLLKKEGLKVALLEASRIAQGTSGYTTAKLTSQHYLIYDKLITEMGEEKAKQYADANETAIDFIENTAKEYNIDCDFNRRLAYIYTNDDYYIDQIHKEAQAAVKLGLKANYTEDIPLPFSVKAALCFKNQAEFHPRKYLLPLAEKIPGEGSYIFENTRIIDVEKGDICTLTTDKGNKITSPKVIIASHFPCYDGLGLYFTRLKPDRSYVIAAKIKEKFPEGMFINAEQPGRSLRSQPYKDGQIILVSGEGHKTAHGENTINHYKNLQNFAQSTYTVEDILYRWSTQDYITLDGVPYIGHITSSIDNIYVATGYAKWGMTNGTAAAIILKDLIIKNENQWQNVFNPSRATSGNAAKSFLTTNLDVAKELLKGKLSGAAKDIELNKGEGRIVEIDGSKYGAYKDDSNNVHIVDTTCTHLGCELKWNSAEKSWDCPCHGSRFSYEGDILEGPALRRLNHYKEEPNRPDPDLI